MSSNYLGSLILYIPLYGVQKMLNKSSDFVNFPESWLRWSPGAAGKLENQLPFCGDDDPGSRDYNLC